MQKLTVVSCTPVVFECGLQLFICSEHSNSVGEGIISVTRVLETTLANHKWTDGGVKSDVSTLIQGSSSVMNDYKNTARRLICTTGGGESKLGGTERRGAG